MKQLDQITRDSIGRVGSDVVRNDRFAIVSSAFGVGSCHYCYFFFGFSAPRSGTPPFPSSPVSP